MPRLVAPHGWRRVSHQTSSPCEQTTSSGTACRGILPLCSLAWLMVPLVVWFVDGVVWLVSSRFFCWFMKIGWPCRRSILIVLQRWHDNIIFHAVVVTVVLGGWFAVRVQSMLKRVEAGWRFLCDLASCQTLQVYQAYIRVVFMKFYAFSLDKKLVIYVTVHMTVSRVYTQKNLNIWPWCSRSAVGTTRSPVEIWHRSYFKINTGVHDDYMTVHMTVESTISSTVDDVGR